MDPLITAAAAKAGVSPQLIDAILAALAVFLAKCQAAPKSHAELAAAIGTFGGRIALRRSMIEAGVRPLSTQGEAVHAAIVETAATMTEAQSAEFLATCQ